MNRLFLNATKTVFLQNHQGHLIHLLIMIRKNTLSVDKFRCHWAMIER
jgi:hypothetical protein